MIMSFVGLISFFVLALAFLIGGHYFIYRSIVSAFGLTNSVLKAGLLVLLMALAAGFFFAAFIAHTSQNLFVKYFYIVTAAWLGIAVNLLLAALSVWLVSWLMGLGGINFDRRIFAVGIFFVSLIISAYGIWNALHPRLKNIDVSIKNLPPAWQGKTIVQLSDVHLGHVHGANFLRRVVDQANAQKPDLILITGDLFDGMDGDLNAFVPALSELRAEKGVFFVTGNHEAYVGLDLALAVLKQTPIRVLDNELVDIDGLQIIGFSYPMSGRQPGIIGRSTGTGEIISSLKGFDKNRPAIAMHHAPTDIQQLKDGGVSLELSGHTHRGQIWPFNLITSLIYGRYDYGLTSDGSLSIYTTNGVGTWGPPMRTGNRPEIPVIKLR